MNRRSFLTALAALPFAPKAIKALAEVKPECVGALDASYSSDQSSYIIVSGEHFQPATSTSRRSHRRRHRLIYGPSLDLV